MATQPAVGCSVYKLIYVVQLLTARGKSNCETGLFHAIVYPADGSVTIPCYCLCYRFCYNPMLLFMLSVLLQSHAIVGAVDISVTIPCYCLC